MNPKVLSEEPINMASVKAELEKIKKRDTELNFRANKTDEYLNQVITIKKKNADDIYTKIIALQIPRIREMHAHKIVDLMPGNVEELKSILTGYTISLSNDNLNKILELVKEELPDKKK